MSIAFSIKGVEQRYEERASWSYTGFTAFRGALAKQLGITDDIYEMEGYGKYVSGVGPVLGDKKWPDIDDPIMDFLKNNGWEGTTISPKRCAAMAPRLREMSQLCVVKLSSGQDFDYDKMMGIKLATQMELAAKNGKELVYS